HHIERNRRPDIAHPNPPQAGAREQGGLDLVGFELGKTGLNIPAEWYDLQGGADREQLRFAARRRCSDDRAVRKSFNRVRADQPVLYVTTRPYSCNADLARPDRFHILQRVDAEIDFLFHQRAVELLGPELLSAEFSETPG